MPRLVKDYPSEKSILLHMDKGLHAKLVAKAQFEERPLGRECVRILRHAVADFEVQTLAQTHNQED